MDENLSELSEYLAEELDDSSGDDQIMVGLTPKEVRWIIARITEWNAAQPEAHANDY